MGLLGWDQDTPGDKTQRGVVAVSYLLILGMLLCSIALAQGVPDETDVSGLAVGLTAFLLFGAAAAIGASLGFLFGLPRSRYAELGGSGTSTTNGAANSSPRSAHYLTNSNLIKVSDWLTTIIIGVGLVNLVKVGPAVGDLSNTLESALGGAAHTGVVGVSVIIIALFASLILCYLWTSIRVRELLEESETHLGDGIPSLIGRTVADAKSILGETTFKLETNGADDAALIARQEPPPGAPAIVGASVSVEAVSADFDPAPLLPD